MSGYLIKRGKTFYVRFEINGQDKRRSLRTGNRAEAEKRLVAWRKQISHISFYGEERRTWPTAVTKYAKEVLPQSVKPKTAQRYLVSLRQLDSFFRPKFIDEVDRKFVSYVISERLKAGVTNATIRRDLTAASRVLAACISWGWRDDNPAGEFDRSIIKERRDPIRMPTDDEVAWAIQVVPPTMGRIMLCALQTGMREDEIVTLKHPQVDLSRPSLTLYKTKGGKPRAIDLSVGAAGTISGTPRHLHSPFVFWHGNGEPYLNFASNYAEQRRKHNIPFRFHDLRHKYAVDYLKNGGNIYTLQQILGHASIKTTEIYLAYLTPEETAASKYATVQKPVQR